MTFLIKWLLNDQKKKEKKGRMGDNHSDSCGAWSAPSPAGFAGLGVSGWLPEVPEGSLQAAASLVSLASPAAFCIRVAWAQEWPWLKN